MKKNKVYRLVLFLLFTTQILFGQKLTLNDLENICNKSNWESVNQFLMNKNWEYYDSEKGDSEKYSTITWSYNKSYGDKAAAWFYIYTYEGYPNKISYSVFNKPSYSVIQNSLSSKGYKLQNSEIEDNELISTYSNNNFILKITTEKRSKNRYSSFDESITAYRFLLIKKSSIYDPNNGKKVDYYYGDNKKAEYTLVNGKINGPLKLFYENGLLKKTGNYHNGQAKGKFTEYDLDGNKTFEYTMDKNERNGLFTAYEDGKISYSTNFKNDIQSGERIEYYYSDETGELYLKLKGEYLNGEKNGTWRLLYIDKEIGERVLTTTNYSKGIKNGLSQDVKGDSLIIANYYNDKLNGDYRVYTDLNRLLFGGVIRTDTTKLILITKGNYTNDLKSGQWKYFDGSNALREEGKYLNGEKNGEWKFYYSKFVDTEENKTIPYSEKLYLVENYSKGKLNGLSKRFSYLNKEKYKCSDLDKNNQPVDSCTRLVYTKVFETSNYINDKLDGPFELRDSLNIIIAKGNFKNNQKSGQWFHRYNDKDLNDNPYHYFMKGSYEKDKRVGEWILFYKEGEINKTINYSNGELHGKYTEWYGHNKPKEIKQFNYGKFKELVVYDSIGKYPERKYEINESSNGYKCRYTTYHSTGKISQVYWLKKDDEISHNWFEILFLLKLNENDKSVIRKDGEFSKYDSNNNPLIIGNYYEETKIGEWTYYFYPQSVKVKIEYENNENNTEKYLALNNELFSGDFILINEEENTKEIRSIKNGLRHGLTELIDLTTGKRIMKIRYKEGSIK